MTQRIVKQPSNNLKGKMIMLDLRRKSIWIVLSLSMIMCILYFEFYRSYSTYNNTKSTPSYATTTDNKVVNLKKENGAFLKGEPLISKPWILSQLKPFLVVYNKRPSKSNKYGSKVMHQFALWCVIKYLEPKHIIESGIYQGQGTWIIRQAAPNAQIITLDPNGGSASIYRDTHKDSLYLTGKKFKDFGSVAWQEILDPKKTLLFIDDHQYAIRRLKEALKFGFEHVMFDDNYWGGGDVLSLRTLIGVIQGTFDSQILKKEDPGHKIKNVTATIKEANDIFNQHISIYWEFPKIWHCAKCNTNKDNYNELFNSTNGATILKKYGLNIIPPGSEIDGYYNIVYVQLQ